MNSQLHIYATAIVAEDKKLGTNDILCFPIEQMAGHSGDLLEKKKMKGMANDESMGLSQANIEKEVTLTAQWINVGSSNRVTAPDVKKGETVSLYRYGGTDKYYWTTMFSETDVRRQEAVLMLYGNEKEHGKASGKENSYWTLIDTVNKKVQLHMSNNDGEVTTYDIILDGKAGTVELIDGKKNQILLESKSNTLTIKVPNVMIKSKNVTVDSGATTFKGGSVTFESTTKFTAAVKMNGNASTSDGASVL